MHATPSLRAHAAAHTSHHERQRTPSGWRDSDDTLARTVRAAAHNEQRAWQQLFGRFTPTIERVARRHRLAGGDVDDVVQRTWLAVVLHIGDLRSPSAIGAWITTTATRESLRVIRENTRELPSNDILERSSQLIDEDEPMPLSHDERNALRSVIASMPPRERALIVALTADPPLAYHEISQRLRIPHGSIGPTRQRCLARMRNDPRLRLARSEG